VATWAAIWAAVSVLNLVCVVGKNKTLLKTDMRGPNRAMFAQSMGGGPMGGGMGGGKL